MLEVTVASETGAAEEVGGEIISSEAEDPEYVVQPATAEARATTPATAAVVRRARRRDEYA